MSHVLRASSCCLRNLQKGLPEVKCPHMGHEEDGENSSLPLIHHANEEIGCCQRQLMSVCVAVDFIESPSEVMPFGRGEPILVGPPFGGALSSVSCNNIHYVFLVYVSLLKFEKLSILPNRTYVEECFSSIRKSVTAFLDFPHIFPTGESLIPKPAAKSSLYKKSG